MHRLQASAQSLAGPQAVFPCICHALNYSGVCRPLLLSLRRILRRVGAAGPAHCYDCHHYYLPFVIMNSIIMFSIITSTTLLRCVFLIIIIITNVVTKSLTAPSLRTISR